MTLGAARLYVLGHPPVASSLSYPLLERDLMKALTAIDETPDEQKARRLVFAERKIAELTLQIDALTRQRATFEKHALKNALPEDDVALIATRKRLQEELDRREREGRGEE